MTATLTRTRPLTEAQLAARAVAVHDPGSLAQRREVLVMLGLVEPAGREVVEPQTSAVELLDLSGPAEAVVHGHSDSFMATDLVRPKVSTAPAGLRNYEPAPEPRRPAGRGGRGVRAGR